MTTRSFVHAHQNTRSKTEVQASFEFTPYVKTTDETIEPWKYSSIDIWTDTRTAHAVTTGPQSNSKALQA